MTIQKIFHALGTLNTITIYFNENEKNKVHQVADYIEKYISEIDDRFSIFKKNSEISDINKNAGNKFLKVSNDTFEILKLSKEYGKVTKGTFDITLKPYIEKIKNKEKNFNLSLRNVNYNNIKLDDVNQSVMLKNKGQEVDLGGIAKGFVIDKIIKILKENEINNVIINLGGTIYNIGEKRNIGIRNPFLPMNDIKEDIPILSIKSENEIFVTSGLYEQKDHTPNCLMSGIEKI